MFGRQITLFQLFGFTVKMDLSWAFLALLIAWSLAQGLFPALYTGLPYITYWWMGVVAVIGLLFSIVFHELAHSLVARGYGLPMRGITLFLFGGIAEMAEEPSRPKVEILMAIAGPIASVLLAGVFYLLAAALTAAGGPTPIGIVAGYLAYLNMLLAIFNLVPAFPMDGGRVLRATLWAWFGDLRRATRIASWIGSLFAFVLIGLGILNMASGNVVGGIWWILIGLFLRGAAASSYYQLLTRRLLEGEPVRRFMNDRPVTVPPDLTIAALVDDYVYKHQHDIYPVTEGPSLVGCVTIHQIRDVPREEWDRVTVRDVVVPCSEANTIEAGEDSVEALSRMQRTGSGRLMVTDHGRLVGIVALKDMLKLIALRMDLGEQR